MNRMTRVRRILDRKGFKGIAIREKRDSLVLEGQVADWDQKIAAGYAAAGQGYKGVINDISVPGIPAETMRCSEVRDGLLEGQLFDVVVIGGGITGCGILRELARYDLRLALLEKEEDLAVQTSGRNDGMIHPGFAASPGSLKAAYNTRGNRLYDRWADELGFPFKRSGSLLLFKTGAYRLLMPYLKSRCRRNGVDGDYRYLSPREVRAREPFAPSNQKGGFFMPSAGFVSPYEVTVALAENAVQNGASVFLNTAVSGFRMDGPSRIHSIETNRGTVRARVVINAAGNWADAVAEMADDRFFSLHGRKGTDCILDKTAGAYLSSALGMPSLTAHRSSHSKGGGLVPCVEGNILVGPTAYEQPFREDFSTDPEDFRRLLEKLKLNRRLEASQIITYFSGIRPATYEEDFIIEPSGRVVNLVHAAGIQSPGVASAPAIAEDVSAMALAILEKEKPVHPRARFEPRRKPPVKPLSLSDEERSGLIRRDPAYGRIVCRCEEVSEGEIREALSRPVPALSMDALKRRTRIGAGRCHGGFCSPRVMELIAEETGGTLCDVNKKGAGSRLLWTVLEESRKGLIRQEELR